MSSLSVLVLLLWTIVSLLCLRFLFTDTPHRNFSSLQSCLLNEVERAYGMKFRSIELFFFSVLICGVPATVYWGAGESEVSMEFSPIWTPILLVGTSILIVVPKVLAWMEKMDWAIALNSFPRTRGTLTNIQSDKGSFVITVTKGILEQVFHVSEECQKASLSQPVTQMLGKTVVIFYDPYYDSEEHRRGLNSAVPTGITYMALA